VTTELHQLAGCLDPAAWNRFSRGSLPDLIGMQVVAVTPDRFTARLEVRRDLMAPNGFLHAATIVALADTACGYATVVNLPAGADGFTTVELKSNFFGTARDGAILCVATPLHRGRTTQVWDAAVSREDDGRALASFRCTQMILGPQ
jgi:uncharacterized protein (TIGR00369 family)